MSSKPRLADTQRREDRRHVPLQRVGVKGVELPLLIKAMGEGHQSVQASVVLTADLPHYFKGTHMSRFIMILEEWRNRPISGPEVRLILEETRTMLDAETAHVDIQFKYFMEKEAPVSKLTSVMGYECLFCGDISDSSFDFRLGVEVPVMNVCPCSKEISEIGAHNQRAIITTKLRCVHGHFIWIEELVHTLEKQGSVEIYPLLKREDEKYVTEHAFRNPKFVEDVVRDSVVQLRNDPRISWFEVECEAEESIHLHSAFAYEEETLRQP